MMSGALLRLWLLTGMGLAALHGWQCWALWGQAGAGQAPYVPRVVPVLDGLSLFIMLPALIVVAQLCWRRRHLGLALLAASNGLVWGLALGLAVAAGFAATSLEMVRWQHGLQALAALAGVAAAALALRLLARG